MIKNQKGIIVVILVVVLALASIPLLSISLETYLITVIISVLIVLLVFFLRKRLKNKLILGHIGAVILFIFFWYMNRFTDTNVSYLTVLIYLFLVWLFYFISKRK